MLLIDGVKYELWTPKKEVEEFHPLVKEHYKEIFGKYSIFIEGNRLESEAGKGSVPDGFVVTLGEVQQWHIVEVELSTHQLYDHIVNQVGRFINGVKNTATQKKIIEAIYRHIQGNKQRKAEFEEAIGSGEIYKLLTDIISKSPILTIIIEKRTRELDEALDLLRYSPIKIVEFQTFTREGVGLAVHAHLFEPLFKPIPPKEQEVVSPELGEKSFEISLPSSCMQSYYIHIPQAKKDLFPSFKTMLELDTDVGTIETGFNIDPQWGAWLSKGLGRWFKAYPELKAGSKVRITAIEPMKKYRLELLK